MKPNDKKGIFRTIILLYPPPLGPKRSRKGGEVTRTWGARDPWRVSCLENSSDFLLRDKKPEATWQEGARGISALASGSYSTRKPSLWLPVEDSAEGSGGPLNLWMDYVPSYSCTLMLMGQSRVEKRTKGFNRVLHFSVCVLFKRFFIFKRFLFF